MSVRYEIVPHTHKYPNRNAMNYNIQRSSVSFPGRALVMVDEAPESLHSLVDQVDTQAKIVCFFTRARAETFLRRFAILDDA